MLQIIKFARKPFYVDAVQVTEDNMEEVAEWCMADGVRTTEKPEGSPDERYIKVRVHRPLTERQTKAFVGDWVLYAGTGFKVYTPRAFEKSFERVTTLTKAQADEAGIHPPIERKPNPMLAMVKASEKQKIDRVDVDHRDAGTGRYVTEEYAEENPETTVSEKSIVEEQAEYAARQAEAGLDEADQDDEEPGAEAERILAELESDNGRE